MVLIKYRGITDEDIMKVSQAFEKYGCEKIKNIEYVNFSYFVVVQICIDLIIQHIYILN